MIDLPKGLFIIKSPSQIQDKNINDLIDISIHLKRKIDIITDININDSLFDGTWARRIDSPDFNYNYVFVADIMELAYNTYQSIGSFLSLNRWAGFMNPISDSCINYNDAINLKSDIRVIGYDAAIIPMVKTNMGNNIFIIFNKLQTHDNHILTQIDPGRHNIIWGNIFRACGFFNTKVKLEKHEL